MKRFYYFSAIILLTISAIHSQDCPNDVIDQCKLQKNCEDCLQLHSCCHWNYQGALNDNAIRCDSKSNLERLYPNSRDTIELNSPSSITEVENANFSDVIDGDEQEAVQFRPQIVDLVLRKGEPKNITITYRPAKNFPLDLYYLMDSTISMARYLDKFKSLGGEIFQRLEELTENYRIAFGSYVDKPAMPFYLTDPENFKNPCRLLDSPNNKCNQGYLFKHEINFTNDGNEFLDKLRTSELSANVDNLEGGFDALMQILRCSSKLNWGNSRKFVVLATESLMHLAGDGLLSGSTKRLPNTCQISDVDQVLSNLPYDYPSLQEVYMQLRRSKTSLIIACSNKSENYYNEIHKLMPFVSKVGSVEGESHKILDLIEDGYYDFVRQVRLIANYSGLEGLRIDFFADCSGLGLFDNKTSQCFNARVGQEINFRVQFLVEEYPEGSHEGVVSIEEENIDEKVGINFKIVGAKCKCESLNRSLALNDGYCKNGHSSCGKCKCDKGWTGLNCDESCTSNLGLCRLEDETGQVHRTCFGNGNCICGKCECNFGFSGTFCDRQCPFDQSNRLICGGQGTCINGTCECDRNFAGEDCTCSTLTDDCLVPGAETICNNRGTCPCNRCECDYPYFGKYCEICNTCEGLCNIYAWSVEDHMKADHTEVTKTYFVQKTRVDVAVVDKLTQYNSTHCLHKFTIGDELNPIYCDVRFVYDIRNESFVNVLVTGGCSKAQQAGIWIGSIIGAIFIAGLLGLLIWRQVATHLDAKEYKRFKDEQMKWGNKANQNPLYKSPISSYKNPMNTENADSKL